MTIKILASVHTRRTPLSDTMELRRVGQISEIAIRKVETSRFDGCKFIHGVGRMAARRLRSIFSPRIPEFPIQIPGSAISKRTSELIYFVVGIIGTTAVRNVSVTALHLNCSPFKRRYSSTARFSINSICFSKQTGKPKEINSIICPELSNFHYNIYFNK